MNLAQQVAQDLGTLTGATFTIRQGEILAPMQLSAAQYHLLDRACGKSDLPLVIGDPSHVCVDDVPERSARIIRRLAADEEHRILRLQAGKTLLEQKTNLKFEFDAGRKMLLSYAAGTNPVPDLIAMDNAKVVERTYILSERDATAVLDIDVEKLKAFVPPRASTIGHFKGIVGTDGARSTNKSDHTPG